MQNLISHTAEAGMVSLTKLEEPCDKCKKNSLAMHLIPATLVLDTWREWCLALAARGRV